MQHLIDRIEQVEKILNDLKHQIKSPENKLTRPKINFPEPTNYDPLPEIRDLQDNFKMPPSDYLLQYSVKKGWLNSWDQQFSLTTSYKIWNQLSPLQQQKRKMVASKILKGYIDENGNL